MKFYIQCNDVKKYDDPVAYDFSKYVADHIQNAFSSVKVERFLPFKTKKVYCENLFKINDEGFSLLIKAAPATPRKKRTNLMFQTSSFDTSAFGKDAFEYLDLYLRDPVWLIDAKTSDYELLKRNVTPFMIDFGFYESCDDVKEMRLCFREIAWSIENAMAKRGVER